MSNGYALSLKEGPQSLIIFYLQQKLILVSRDINQKDKLYKFQWLFYELKRFLYFKSIQLFKGTCSASWCSHQITDHEILNANSVSTSDKWYPTYIILWLKWTKLIPIFS